MEVSRKGWRVLSGKLGLRSKFILINVSMVLGIVSVLTLYFISIQRSMLRNELQNRAVSLSKSFAHNCGYPVLLEDITAIKQMIAGIMNEEDVAFVQIRRADGSMLFEDLREIAGQNRDEWEQPLPVHDGRGLEITVGRSFLIVHAPITKPAEEDLSALGESGEGQGVKSLGTGVVGFSLGRTKSLIVSSVESTLLITVVIGIVGVVLALSVVRHLMSPMLSVMNGTKEIALGNLSYRVEVQRDDELGRLAGAFNEMAYKLEDNGRALNEYSKNLEKMVRDRTIELSLREGELTLILENNPAGILLVDYETGKITWANSNASRILEGSKERIEGHHLEEFVLPGSQRRWDSVEAGAAGDALECRFVTAEGEEMPVLSSVSRISYKGREHLLNAFFDIAERKKLEAQLLQAQKMGAIGTLAGGIAHDFNNLLQAVSGYVQLVLLREMVDKEDQYYLQQVEKSVQRAAELIKQLLTFSRKVESRLRTLDLNGEVEKISKLLTRTLPKMIDIEIDLCSGLKKIEADPAHLEQMIMNLAVNARDAMPYGGKLVFRTALKTLDEELCKTCAGMTPGEYAVLTVKDTGEGIDEKTIEHIFEPFFTTKEVGKGTGLGLAMVYGIVKNHRGHITCSSTSGQGATFEIYLPAAEETAAPCKTPSADDEEIRGGNETILLVDDDELILAIGRDILEPVGYRIITASNGEDAMEKYLAQKDEIHLIALDLGMPGMGGYRCLEQILKIDPGAKVIIASGYNDLEKKEELLRAGARAFLGKPYRYRELIKMVRNVLDEGAPASALSQRGAA